MADDQKVSKSRKRLHKIVEQLKKRKHALGDSGILSKPYVETLDEILDEIEDDIEDADAKERRELREQLRQINQDLERAVKK